MKQQELLYDHTYDTVSLDRSSISKLAYDELSIVRLPDSELVDQYIYSVGVNVPFIIENDKSAFIGVFNVGFSNIRSANYWNYRRFNMGMSFEVVEKEFGLNLRTEIQYFGPVNPPFISFNIAKYFNLKTLVSYIE